MTGTVSLSPTLPNDNVTSRQVVVTLNGTVLPPIEAVSSPAVFTCQPGDTYSVVDTDINLAGPSPMSQPFTGIVPSPAVPAQPVVTGVTFV